MPNVRRHSASIQARSIYQHKKHGSLRVIRDVEKQQILEACHSAPTSGHLGVNKTANKVITRYYWPSHYKDIEEYIGKFLKIVM